MPDSSRPQSSTGVTVDRFWRGLADILERFTPQNRALLAERDHLQSRIDEWWRTRRGKPVNQSEHLGFLRELDYLVPEPPAFQVSSANVDAEISSTAGPQLIAPA